VGGPPPPSPPPPPPPPPRNMISWYTHCLWIFKVSGLNCFSSWICVCTLTSHVLEIEKKNSRLTPENVCSSRSTHTRLPRFIKEHRKMGGFFCRGLFYQMSASYLILGRKRF
jgi:hypothetical protein